MSLIPTQISPPSWRLEGNGYIFRFRFAKAFVQAQGFLEDYQRSTYQHGLLGLGTIMLLDYKTSDVGPFIYCFFVGTTGCCGSTNKTDLYLTLVFM